MFLRSSWFSIIREQKKKPHNYEEIESKNEKMLVLRFLIFFYLQFLLLFLSIYHSTKMFFVSLLCSGI